MRCVLAVSLLFTLFTGQIGSTGQPLTNEDVGKLLQEHIDAAVIVKIIKSSTNSFDTSPEALLKLRKVGASQQILDAMVIAKVSQQQANGGAGQTAREPLGESMGGISSIAPAIRASRGRICAANLAECLANGCAPSGSDHAAFNEVKRRQPITTAYPVVLRIPDDFHALQQEAERKVGSGGDIAADSRAELTNFQTSGGKVGEGSFVRVFGFLATVPLQTHPNTGESVNCGLKGEGNNDLHIPLAGDPSATDYRSEERRVGKECRSW